VCVCVFVFLCVCVACSLPVCMWLLGERARESGKVQHAKGVYMCVRERERERGQGGTWEPRSETNLTGAN